MGGKYIIKNAAHVVTVNPSISNLKDCDVIIKGAFIKAVGPNLEHSSDHIIIDGTESIVSPGFVDTHRHAWQSQLRTLCSDMVLADYLLMVRHVYGSCYTAHDAYVGNYCGALENIDNGITCLIDHSHIINTPAHADMAIKGLRDAKVRGIYCYGFYPNPVWKGCQLDEEKERSNP
jgi:cytosine/adenosine deaminase-related metal-dependent hydrolase